MRPARRPSALSCFPSAPPASCTGGTALTLPFPVNRPSFLPQVLSSTAVVVALVVVSTFLLLTVNVTLNQLSEQIFG